MFNLPSSTATMLSLVILDLWPPAYEALSRRVSFANRLMAHDLSFVRSAFEFDRNILFRAQLGWHYDTFLLFRSLFNREKAADFSIDRVATRIQVIVQVRTRFVFFMIKESDEATLAPFRLFESVEVLQSFRSFLGQISISSAHLVVLICSSGHRFRFFEWAAVKCPFCPSNSWLTSHLFTCPMVEPVLARNGVLLTNFESSMRTGNWRSLLHLLFETLTVWKNSFVDCIIDDCAIQTLHQDALTLT
jgi:hypothetical protein